MTQEDVEIDEDLPKIVRIDDEFKDLKEDWIGTLVWRIEEFKLVKWKDFGAFYTGDSYLIYHSYMKGDSKRIIQDIYFWLGKESSTDEIGTAAYKAVELDDFFGDAPIQHREVQYHESEAFRELWNEFGGIRYMDGGVDSGFKKVVKESDCSMYQVKGAKNPVLQQVPCTGTSLNHGDVFIVHKTGHFWLWFGKNANRMEKNKGVTALDNLKFTDPKAEVTRFENSETDAGFWEALGGKTTIAEASEGGDDKEHELSMVKELIKVNEDGTFAKVEYKQDNLKPENLFIIQCGNALVVFIGKKAPKEQQKKVFIIATQYLKENKLPEWTPISTVKQGIRSEVLAAAFI